VRAQELLVAADLRDIRSFDVVLAQLEQPNSSGIEKFQVHLKLTDKPSVAWFFFKTKRTVLKIMFFKRGQ
jgi:hypothetical protein